MNIKIEAVDALVPNGEGFRAVNTDVYISDGRIASLGNAPRDFSAQRTLSGKGRLLIPGLVNAHTHAYMSLFRNCADDLSFGDWLFGRIEPMEDKLLPDDHYWGTLLGICEMLRTGTTTYLDMHMMPEKCARAAAESGIRAVLSRGLVGSSADDAGGLRRIAEAKADLEQFGGCERMSFMLAPHAPYSCSPEFLETVIGTAEQLNLPIHIHLSESCNEVDAVREKYNCTPIELMERVGLFKLPCTAAHCVQLTDNDIDILAENNVRVVTCPVSNMKLGNGFAPVPKLLERGITVALGTDGAASNNSLDMLRELSFLTLIHKGNHATPQCVSAEQGLRAATVGGASAVGLGGVVGEIREGAAADLVLLDETSPSLTPCAATAGAIAYSSCSASVRTVIVGGDILLDNGELTTLDEERVRFEACKINKRIVG